VPKLQYPIPNRRARYDGVLVWLDVGLGRCRRGHAECAACLRTLHAGSILNDRRCPIGLTSPPARISCHPLPRGGGLSCAGCWIRGVLPAGCWNSFTGIPEKAESIGCRRRWVYPIRADPKLAQHRLGLNLSRARMLEGIAHGLEAGDPAWRYSGPCGHHMPQAALHRRPPANHSEGGHLARTFAVYLTSGWAGLRLSIDATADAIVARQARRPRASSPYSHRRHRYRVVTSRVHDSSTRHPSAMRFGATGARLDRWRPARAAPLRFERARNFVVLPHQARTIDASGARIGVLQWARGISEPAPSA